MEAHLTQVLNGIARSMAAAGLKKALSFEAVRLASHERVQQRLLPERSSESFGEQNEIVEENQNLQRTRDQILKDFAQDRVQQGLVEPLAADGGSFGGSAEDGVSGGIQRRTVEQVVDMLAPVLPQERVSARTEAVEMTKISCQKCIEAVKNATQERNSERSQVIEVPRTLRQESVEEERISERNEISSQDQHLHAFVDFVEAVKIVLQKGISEMMCGQFGVIEVTGFAAYSGADANHGGKFRGRQNYPS